MLNSTYPEVNRTDEVAILINNSRDLLQLSTFEHLELLHQVESKITQLRSEKEAAEAITKKYKTKGYIIDQDYSDMVDLAQRRTNQLADSEALVQEQQAELYRLKNLGWFARLFNYKVYV
jgi:hypothetical protein